MNMTPEEKNEIDNMSYESLLRRWRFEPIADDYFHLERGTYFAKIMQEKADQIEPGDLVAISKKVGWGD